MLPDPVVFTIDRLCKDEGFTKAEAFAYLRELVDHGLISLTGPDRNGFMRVVFLREPRPGEVSL